MSATASSLDRFVAAQDGVLAAVEAELAAGRKRTHWMWFVFPQIAGLGRSDMARHYALASLDEARLYLAHPLLGERLRRHVGLLLRHEGASAREMLGSPDDLKLRSCLTLFRAAADSQTDRELFDAALRAFYAGAADPATLQLL